MRPTHKPYSLEELERAGLTKKQEEIYRLIAIEGRSVTEAARMLGVSKAAVSKILKRASVKLEKYSGIKRDILHELRGEIEELKKELESIREIVNTLIIFEWMNTIVSSRKKF